MDPSGFRNSLYGGTSGAPMSERQQLALIKRLEKQQADAASSQNQQNQSNDNVLVSPPRTPLQVVNGPSSSGMISGSVAAGPGNNQNSSSNSSADSSATASPLGNKRIGLPGTPKSPAVDRLLKKISKKNGKGETALHTAAIKGSRRLVKTLLQLGADPNAQDNAEWSPLHEACNRGNHSVVKLLHEFGADINLKGFAKDSPLHDAARNGHIKVVKFLVRAGADTGAKNASGRTPREEAELVAVRCDNEDLRNTVSYLTERDEQASDASRSSPESSAGEEDEEENENDDVARFLGLSRSPGVQQAFQSLGLRDFTPKSRRRKQKQDPEDEIVDVVNTKPLSKIRLTYDGMDKTDVKPDNADTADQPKEQTKEQPETSPTNKPQSPKTEPEPASTATVSSSTATSENAAATVATTTTSAEKRAAESGENVASDQPEEEVKKKKPRKDDSGTTASPTTSASASPAPPSATTKQGRSTRGSSSEKSTASGTKAKSSKDRKSPSGSAANSPKKPQEEEEEDPKGLKVPPLKIVLSGSSNGSTSVNSGEVAPEPEPEQPEKMSVEVVEEPKSSASAASATASAASRITRSRANRGTPGPYDESQSDGTASGDSGQAANQSNPENRPSAYDYNVKKRKLRSQVEENLNSNTSANATNGNQLGAAKSSSAGASGSSEPPNDIEKFLNIRKQVEQRRKNLFPVQPKPPEGFKDYLMNRKTYLLQQNAAERLRSLPMIQPPHSLDGPLRQLFKEQEQERYKLRMKHVVEKEKLVLAVEQEILRVHGRAARALANQSLPFSVCTILRDEEIYTPIDPELEEKNRDIRSRYNGRLFLSWLQDVDDKWEKIKEQMVLRHHNEAESLNAVQKMDWEWKVNELNLQQGAGSNGSQNQVAQVDDLHIPMVHVSDDFDLADCRQ